MFIVSPHFVLFIFFYPKKVSKIKKSWIGFRLYFIENQHNTKNKLESKKKYN